MEFWSLYKTQLIHSATILLLFVVIRQIFTTAVTKTANKFDYHQTRITVFKRVFNIILTIVLVVLLAITWGVNQSRLFFYISSFLTVLAVGFVAQWSILSNITTTIIIFFFHPIKIGDEMSIHEKDSLIHGKVTDIGMIFITIATEDGQQITIPSNLFIQKAIKSNSKIT